MARDWENLPEDELLRAVLAKEPGSWVGFYKRYERLVISCVKKALHRYTAVYADEDVEDIVNTVCLNLVKDDFKKLRSYDAGRGYKLSSWVGLIATNTALDALRRREPLHATLDAGGGGGDDEMAPTQIPDSGPDPGESLERREQWNALLQAIRDLPESDRMFLELYYDQEAEPEEIAKKMGIAVNTVYSRKNKLREKLRKLVEDAVNGKVGATSA
jgi:RNA polymerase sigma-70 factor (ECF subfamily)